MEIPSDINRIRDPLLGTSSKGGSRTLPFIIVNEAFEKVASYGLLPNMIVYLMRGYGLDLATGSNFIYMWSAATNLTPVIGGLLADSYVGRFWMIGLGSIGSLLGMVLLWLTTVIPGLRPCDESGSHCTDRNIFQLAFLASSFGFMSIGAGGIRSSSMAFGADQLTKGDNNVGSARMLEKYFNWYYFAASASVVIAMTCVVYVQDHFGWRVGFGVPVTLMLMSAVSFFLASHLYLMVEPQASSILSAFPRVLVASWKKRHLSLSSETTEISYYCTNRSKLIMPRDRIRFLNKACVIENAKEELSGDGKALDPWRLCTVDEVEELKPVIKVIPIWSTGIMMSVCFSMPSSILQTETLDRHITPNFEVPAGSFGTFMIIFLVLWIALYDRVVIPLASKIRGEPVHLSVKTRMGIGLFLSSLSVALSAIIESARRRTAIEEGYSDNPQGQVHMSAFWLLLPLSVSGVAEALFVVGQNEFFYSELPKSLASVATNLYGVAMSLANVAASLIMSTVDIITSKDGKESWVSSNINKAHFDYYYFFLALLGLLNFLYYLICCKVYGSSQDQVAISADGLEEVED